MAAKYVRAFLSFRHINRNRAATFLVFCYQLIVLAAFVFIPIQAYWWLNQPFLGVFVEHTLMFNTVAPSRAGEWELQRLNLPFGHQLYAIDSQTIQTVAQLNYLLSQRKIGDNLPVDIRLPNGELRRVNITLRAFPNPDRLTHLVIPYLTGLVYLATSLWVFGLRRYDAAGRVFAVFTSAFSITVAGLFDVYTTSSLTPLWSISLALVGGALFHLATLFPEESPILARYPFFGMLGYIPAAILALLSLPTLYNRDRPTLYQVAWLADFLFCALALLFFLIMTIQRSKNSDSPIIREQSHLILWGTGISFGPLTLWFILNPFFPNLDFTSYLLLPLAIFPAVTGYAILRYRLLSTDFVLSRLMLYTLLGLMAAGGYALAVTGINLAIGAVLPPSHPIITGLIVFLLAILFNPIFLRLRNQIDQIFFRGRSVIREQLQSYSRKITRATELPRILEILRSTIDQLLSPSQFHIFLRDPHSEFFHATPNADSQLTTDLRFPLNSALATVLERRRSAIYLGDSASLPTLLQQDRARLALLGVQLFVPLPAQHQLAGWLALGPRNSGEPYASRDLGFLESLCDQAGLAIERAQVVVNLERRVHEMDALTRVAQGINITQAFDDILELIYTQASLVIQFKDFRVALTKPSGTLYYAFYLENDERLVDRENVSIQTGHALEEAIIESNRPILTDDYERECRNRGLLPGSAWLYSWMGVPLQTRSETFGAISLGSRDPALYYSDQQRSLLQAIADQAAGAIVKARLLQESEQRARQLSTLNDIGRSLTSTLELRPLLDQILSSAVEILNCQAGSLFLIDDQTGELIFEVTVGPVAGDLVGQRLPPGTGIVGKSANSGLPIIANDVRQKMEWFQKPDEKTGFITRDLLVVPLQVKERVIGVIEVINKIDGSRFITQDQDLLATFASQAAVAIENARLYTQTDAALSARVEELSVMQRIDRELNASLDLERALRITLEWSLRQANSDAGLVGLFTHGENGSGPGLRVMASHGYPAEIMQQPLLSKTPGITAAFNEGQVQYYKANPITDEPKHTLHALLEDASFQVVVPIRRKSDVIGALLLEARNNKQILPETLNFLSRLSDHAAIAVTNGQLYAEVQAANLAKSEFVSLVSHELKTPMTSIRGYADLLAQGAVGPVNEAQANFLGTIRANVNRMATLVSDLADVSRIEAGRLRLEFSVVNLGDIIQESIRSAKAQADEKQQTLQLEMPQDLPKVWGDPNRLMQIFGNLISNAIKYTPLAGLITIQITPAANRWDVTGAPEVVLVDIADTGYGIAIEDQKKIFLKFFRSEDQNIRTAPGTGLGLNITRHLVEMQGGRIWFVSEPGKGTTFSFTVPISAT